MAECNTSLCKTRTAAIQRNLLEATKTLHKHVVGLGGQYEAGNHGDSRSDFDHIEHLSTEVMTLCTFLESLSSAQSDSNQDVTGMWKWIQWLDRNITPYSEKSIPPDPTDIGKSSTSKVQTTETIVKRIWQHNQGMIRERQEILSINVEHAREIATLDMIIKRDPRKDQVKVELKRLNTKCTRIQTTSTEEIERLTSSLKKTTNEKDYWISRMSSMAGKKLRDNNPEVIDLNDPNRPLKLADKFSELYDNQWTNAFDHLHGTRQMSEETAIQHLSALTKECYIHCSEKACQQLQQLQMLASTGALGDDVEAFDSKPDRAKEPPVSKPDGVKEPRVSKPDRSKTSSPAELKTLNDARKEFAHIAEQYVIKDLLPILLNLSGSEHDVTNMTDYLSECIALCWGMVVQDPPVVLHWPIKERGSNIDRDTFNLYTKNGTQLSYEVWPAMLLHKHGPLLKKGGLSFLQHLMTYAMTTETEGNTTPKERVDRRKTNGGRRSMFVI